MTETSTPNSGAAVADHSNNEVQKAAREYAWNWFKYHAGQRQTVFRFFLIFAGAIAGTYMALLRDTEYGPPPNWVPWLGVGITVLAFLFWRLDVRSRTLIRCAESYLIHQETQLSTVLHTEAILIATHAHTARDLANWSYGRLKVYTFQQIYRIIFLLVAVIGMLIFLSDSRSPIRFLVAKYISVVCG